MSVIGHSPLAGASGAAGGAGPLYVDDLFSAFLYDGTGSGASPAVGQTINNGIDLSGEGGLVWTKNRDTTYPHILFDTARGATKYLVSNSTAAEVTATHGLTAFNSNGYTMGTMPQINEGTSGYEEHVSWTFRKAPGFFDVVTYSGTGSAQNISHSLGSVPGMIMIHCRDGTHDWEVYHRSTGATKSFHLNSDDAQTTDSTVWNNTTPTSSVFTVGTSSNVNQNGHGYVAYVFAHDDQSFGTDSDEAIIKCGSYTGNGTAGQEVNLGFEPQFVLLKGANTASTTWWMFDVMRGMVVGGVDERLRANANTQSLPLSTYGANLIKPTPTGFALETTSGEANDNGTLFVYMAIRRPHKPPEAGTEVFKAVQTTSQPVSVGFPTDLIVTAETAAGAKYWVPRLTNNYLTSTSTGQESAGATYFKFDLQNSYSTHTFWGSSQNINWYFRRAPGFFDVVAYTGNGLNQHNISHNLGAVPELMIVKKRNESSYSDWTVYYKSATAGGANKYLYLNSNSGETTHSTIPWNNTEPTATQFTVYNSWIVNRSGYFYIAYLFASLDGISKVGSYSGTGSNINVDCGFTAGARFVLIKRTNSTGDWYVWDSTRGIVSGNDPYLLLNTSAAQVTNTDYIDPLNAGFTVTSSAPAALNASGGTYLFLAIA